MVEWISKIINNPWIISIVTGVMVYIVTNLYSKFKEKKEYRKNINQVTEDIVVMLQEFIVEKQLPEKGVLFSYYIATCEKYNVLAKDTKSIVEILDFLTKEILDSQFLNATNKLEYCNIIETYKLEIKKESVYEIFESKFIEDKLMEEDVSNSKIAFIIGVVSSIITLISFFNSEGNTGITKPTKDILILSLMIIVILSILIYLVYKNILKRK